MRKAKTVVLPGQKYGRWTVLNDYIKTKKDEIKWLCRCDCGTERYVLERCLKYGESRSCGCLQRENAGRAGADLTGRVFGELTVLRMAEQSGLNRGKRWLCKCSCGNYYESLSSLLTTGKRKHCGDGRRHQVVTR